ncbi:cytochrome c oxidase assembly protein COX19 [Bemisia tabaci]|uniref:cytochrome c oxidase assembly protein COX19 n=1 Tax=Bemisia tabaci TaxID=7038 RepID=UPI003B28D55D
MTSHNLGQKRFFVTPPEKGVFPLDHEAQCKRAMLQYMICLQKNENSGSACRVESKEYLECRMKNNLMAEESWSFLGFSDLEEKSKSS